MKKSKYEVNYLIFQTGLPRRLATKIEDIEITPKGNFKVKLKLKIDTKGWKMIMGTCK